MCLLAAPVPLANESPARLELLPAKGVFVFVDLQGCARLSCPPTLQVCQVALSQKEWCLKTSCLAAKATFP